MALGEREYYYRHVVTLATCPKCGKRYGVRADSFAFCECGHLDIGHELHRTCVRTERERLAQWVEDQFKKRAGESLKEKSSATQWSDEELEVGADILKDSF